LRWLIDAAILASLSVAALYGTARIALVPADPERGIALVFAPWTGADQAFARTLEVGGRFVRYGGVPFVTIVIPETGDYRVRAFAAGAWLVLDPQVIAACLSPFAAAAAPGRT
jgi:hypothetical protein